MNQEEASEFKQQRDAEVEKSRKEKREEIFAQGRAGPPPMEEEKNVSEKAEENK